MGIERAYYTIPKAAEILGIEEEELIHFIEDKCVQLSIKMPSKFGSEIIDHPEGKVEFGSREYLDGVVDVADGGNFALMHIYQEKEKFPFIRLELANVDKNNPDKTYAWDNTGDHWDTQTWRDRLVVRVEEIRSFAQENGLSVVTNRGDRIAELENLVQEQQQRIDELECEKPVFPDFENLPETIQVAIKVYLECIHDLDGDMARPLKENIRGSINRLCENLGIKEAARRNAVYDVLTYGFKVGGRREPHKINDWRPLSER